MKKIPVTLIIDNDRDLTLGLREYSIASQDMLGVKDGGLGRINFEGGSVLVGDDKNSVQTVPRGSIKTGTGVSITSESSPTSMLGQEITIELNLSKVNIYNMTNNTTKRIPKNRFGEESIGTDKWDLGTSIFSLIPENDSSEEF